MHGKIADIISELKSSSGIIHPGSLALRLSDAIELTTNLKNRNKNQNEGL
jgi:hypothetical protein